VSSAAFWRRPAVFPERQLPERLEAARARARAVDRPARHWASPAALAQPAPVPRLGVSAVWDARVLRPAAREA